MSPQRTAALVVLFTLAALSSVATFVEAYRGEGLWARGAGHQFALEGELLAVSLEGKGDVHQSLVQSVRRSGMGRTPA